MPVCLSPGAIPPIKSNGVAISNSFPTCHNLLAAKCCWRSYLGQIEGALIRVGENVFTEPDGELKSV